MHDSSKTSSGRRLELIKAFLKLGFMSYGGPAIMGIMQAELQEKRRWLSKEQFVEGLALVNLLPGAGATQLGIYIGYLRGGVTAGIVAGLAFLLPALFIMLALAGAYETFGALPLARHAFYGLGPVVLAIFLLALIRIGKATITSPFSIAMACIALVAAFWSVSAILILLLAGSVGLAKHYSLRAGLIGAVLIFAAYTAVVIGAPLFGNGFAPSENSSVSLLDVGAFFFKVGAFTFGGGLTMLSFLQTEVVDRLHWLTQREFLDGLALGQLTPGPILMLAAFVGFKVAGLGGAIVAAVSIFLPSFLLMLALLPLFLKARDLAWLRAIMRGISPAVIGVIAASLFHMAPHALPDAFTLFLFGIALTCLLVFSLPTLSTMLGGALVGLKTRVSLLFEP